MSEYGVQSDGSFRKKPVDVIREQIKEDFINELGKDLSLRESSTETQIINAVSLEISRQWGAIEGSYYASFYEDAYGKQLDKQLAKVGFQRRPQRGATGEVTFSTIDPATDDITISSGTRVATEGTQSRPQIPFKTTETAILSEGQTSVSGVPIEALEVWETDVDEEYLGEETNLSADTITEIINPIAGIESVTNPRPTGTGRDSYTEGQDEETDPEFKNRYQRSFGNIGDATKNAVQANLVEADADIVAVDVEEIHDTANDKYGAEVSILAPGVDDDVIAQAIFDSMAVGLESFGAESGTAIDDTGDPQTENFKRATPVDITVDATVTTDENYGSNSTVSIINSIIRYIGGTDTNGTTYPGLVIGEDVIFDQVFRRVINEAGVVEADVQIAESGNTLGKTNVSVPDGQTARIDVNDITITEA